MMNLGTAAAHTPLQIQKVSGAKTMPFVSQKQRGYFNANRKKMEKQGVDVDEYNQASKGMNLPVRQVDGKKHWSARAANKGRKRP